MDRHPLDATASAIFTANNAATRRTPPPRSPRLSFPRRAKGKEAKLAYTGNVMTENRNGFVVEAELRQVSGIVERETAKDMIVRYSPGAKRITVGADKGFDTADFVADMRDFNVTPHVAQNTTNRLSAIDHRTTRHWIRDQSAETQAGRGAVRLGQDYRGLGSANAAWREEARLQVHADDGGLRPHQTSPVDRSGGLRNVKPARTGRATTLLNPQSFPKRLQRPLALGIASLILVVLAFETRATECRARHSWR